MRNVEVCISTSRLEERVQRRLGVPWGMHIFGRYVLLFHLGKEIE